MVSQNAIDLDPMSAAVIRIRSRQLARRAHLNRHDREDLAQELALDLVKRLSRFDVTRGKIGSFSYMVLQRATSNHVRRFYSPKWRSRPRLVDAIDDIASDPSLDLRIDLETALSHLPSEMQAMAWMLLGHSVAAAARELGVSRTTFYSRLRVIRRCFEEHGLQDYLD